MPYTSKNLGTDLAIAAIFGMTAVTVMNQLPAVPPAKKVNFSDEEKRTMQQLKSVSVCTTLTKKALEPLQDSLKEVVNTAAQEQKAHLASAEADQLLDNAIFNASRNNCIRELELASGDSSFGTRVEKMIQKYGQDFLIKNILK